MNISLKEFCAGSAEFLVIYYKQGGDMRSAVLSVLLLSVIIPGMTFANKASTIDELAQMYDITKCIDCHEDKYEDWKSSTMGNSVVDPRVLRGMRTFIRLALDKEKELGRGDLTICLNCHVPQIKDATPELVLHIGDLVLTAVEDKDEAKREEAKKELSKLNLNCLGCHNLKALGFGAKPEETVIYGPEDVESNTHESIGFRTRRSDLISTSEFCAQCHHCPPDVPWEQCPTLYTTYIDHFVSKGRKESCQDCHMNGKERVHKFYGPNNIDFLRSALSLSVNVRQTRYIDIYENKKMPAVVIKTVLKNNAGHVIPHGCAIMPRMISETRITDQDGKEVFYRSKEFSVGDLYFKGGKNVAMAEWDVTATEHFDLGIEPDEPDERTYIVPLSTDTASVVVTSTVKYIYSRSEIITIGEDAQKIEIEN